MPIRFYSDALGKVIEPKYEAIPSKTVDELMEELMEELITKKYVGTIYTSECEEKENIEPERLCMKPKEWENGVG